MPTLGIRLVESNADYSLPLGGGLRLAAQPCRRGAPAILRVLTVLGHTIAQEVVSSYTVITVTF
jgi:hypothetical protein